MRELMISLNQTIKGARAAYFSNLIVNSNQFTTINQLVRPSPPAIHASSPADCEKFMSFFIGKVSSTRSHFILHVLPLQHSVVLFHCPILLLSLY